MGTPEFAVASLQELINGHHEVAAVVTATDKLGGRGGNQLLQSEVKKFAVNNNLKLLQPKSLNSKKFLNELKELNADIFIVVAFRMLPEVVWNMPKMGTFNIHASLLPKYRGAAPINWAIINGEKETGISFFKLKHEIDTGNILLQNKLSIDADDDFGSLYTKLKSLGAKTLRQGLELLMEGKENFIPQNENEVCHAPKIFHETCKIDFNQTVDKVYNFIRGLSPHPGAYFDFFGEEMKVFKAATEYVDHDETIGGIDIKGRKEIKIACTNGYIKLLELKLQGKKRMSVSDFLNGYTTKSN